MNRPIRPPMTLAELRKKGLMDWQIVQSMLWLYLNKNPDIVQKMAEEGCGREQMHEELEGLYDSGIIRIIPVHGGADFAVYDPEEGKYFYGGRAIDIGYA